MVDKEITNIIINKIDERIELLSKKNKHCVISLGTIEESKEEKIYHKAGKGRSYCTACERIRELKKLRKEIELIKG